MTVMEISGFRIRGIEGSSLLIRRFDETLFRRPALRDQMSPEEKFAAARYIDDEDHDCFPARYMKNAMIMAAKFAPESFKNVKRSSIMIVGDGADGESIVIENVARKPMKPRMHVVSFGFSAAKAFSKSKPFVCNAEYKDWGANIRIVYDPAVLDRDLVILLAAAAGELVGLGVWRPEMSGTHGRFVVPGHRISKSKSRKWRAVEATG